MTRTKKLEPVVKHVKNKEQEALQAVAFSQQQLNSQQLRLEQLVLYKAEYANQQGVQQSVTYTAIQLKEFSRFLDQLDITIQQQKQVVELAQREVNFKRDKWKLTRSKSDAMDKVMDNIQLDENKKAQKMEQKQMDELALRISYK